MPKFKLTGPDGGSYIVDAPDERAAREAFDQMQSSGKGDRLAPVNDPRTEFAERPTTPWWKSAIMGAGDMASFGFADEIAAGVGTGLGMGSYDEVLEQARARNTEAQEANPGWYMGGQVAGSIPSIVAGPGRLAAAGAGLGAKVGRGVLGGSAMGGAYGVGSGEGFKDRLFEGAVGAGVGGTIGGVLPAAGAGIGRLVGGSLTRSAPATAARAFRDDGLTPDAARARLAELGPEGMIADLGPNLQRQAGALASVPGRGQGIVRDALTTRRAGANGRIQGELNATLGPAPIPAHVDAGIVAGQRALGPQYEAALRGARAVDTQGIANQLDSEIVNLRGAAQAKLAQVRDMLNITGQEVLDPNPGTLLNTRQAIDGMLDGETDGNVIRVLTAARRQIDQELTNAVPGIKQVDAQFAELARQREAFERGRTVLESGRNAPVPAELADEVAAGAGPRGMMVGPSAVPFRMSQGARAEIERIIGTNNNDVVALNRLIKGEGSWNRDRLATLFGPDRADRIIRVLDRERQFAETGNVVMQNSETAARQAAQREIAPEVSGRGDAGMFRSAFNFQLGDATARGLGYLTGSSAAARQEARNEALARALIASAPHNTDPVISEIARALIARTKSDTAEEAFNKLLLPVARGAGVPAALDAFSR